jgi:hypothetical protein
VFEFDALCVHVPEDGAHGVDEVSADGVSVLDQFRLVESAHVKNFHLEFRKKE